MTNVLHTNNLQSDSQFSADENNNGWDRSRSPQVWEESTRMIQTSRPDAHFPAARRFGPELPEQLRAPISEYPASMIDQGKYWMGGFITALVAGLVAIIGVVLAQGIFNVPMLSVAHTTLTTAAATYGLVWFGAAVAAALVFFGMMYQAPRPALYFGWLVALLTVLSSLIVFIGSVTLVAGVVHAGLNLLIGMVVIGLTIAAGSSSRRQSR